MPPRIRRLLPHAIGLALTLVVLWQGGAELEERASQAEPFALFVDEPAPVFELAPAGEAPAPQTWSVRISPASDAARATWWVDDRRFALALDDLGAATPSVTDLLGSEAGVPGWHFVESRVDRRGGRSESVVEPILVGRFAEARIAAPERCDIALSASEDLLESLVVPLFEAQALPKLRENQHMGPATELAKAELELREHTVHFELELAGHNTLEVSGLVAIWVDEERRLYLHLVSLDEVDFRGDLRTDAQSAGAGGGALIGGLIAGPLAPVGAIAGWWVADDFVTDQARKVVRKQIDEGLTKLSGVELIPKSAELIAGDPRSAVELGFCSETGVHPGGLVAGLWIEPVRSEATLHELGVPGPLTTGAEPNFVAIDDDNPEDLRVELSIDLVNSLLTEWTRTGLLLDLLEVDALLEHANREMAEWTPLELVALRPTRPPLLTPAGGPAQGWAFGLGGLEVETRGTETPWGEVRVGGAGTLQPVWDQDAGTLRLTGTVDRLAVGCAKPAGDQTALRPCFASVLEAVELRERLDAHLRPDAQDLPTLDVRGLLSERLNLAIGSLELSRPLPGILRLSAKVNANGETETASPSTR